MKSLKEYLIAERLRINKDVSTLTNVDIPILIDDDMTKPDLNHKWKTIKVPAKKFVIFKDRYRMNQPHFATLGDFLMQVTMFQNDYEDYTPDKDIKYASDDLYDILNWYLDYMGFEFKEDVEEGTFKSADSAGFFKDIFDKNWDENDFIPKNGQGEPTEKDLENYPEFYSKQV